MMMMMMMNEDGGWEKKNMGKNMDGDVNGD